MSVPTSRFKSTAMVLAVAFLSMASARSAPATMIQLVAASSTLAPGASETISVVLNPSVNFQLTSADLDIQFDNTRFSVSNVQLGTLDPASNNFSLLTNTPTNVLISSISLNSGNGTAVTTSGTLETFTLTALSNAPAGNGAIQFLASSGNSHTDVFEDPTTGGPLVLTPAPVNGVYDSNIDTTVAVSVPEPSSLLLMGLGGASIVLGSRLRKKARRPAAA